MDTNTVSGFIYYKTAEIKEIHFESITYNGIMTILNDHPNNNTNYMITIDASSQILENVNNIYKKIIEKSKQLNNNQNNVLYGQRKNLFKKLETLESVNDLFNLKEQEKTLKNLIEEIKVLKNKELVDELITEAEIETNKKNIIRNTEEITTLLKSNKDTDTFIMKLFFMVKTYNTNFVQMFNKCDDIDDINKCFDNIKIDPQRIIFFSLVFDKNNNINKIYINNDTKSEGYIDDINNLLKNVDYNIIYKLTFITELLKL